MSWINSFNNLQASYIKIAHYELMPWRAFSSVNVFECEPVTGFEKKVKEICPSGHHTIL
jgi:hypothetical protein